MLPELLTEQEESITALQDIDTQTLELITALQEMDTATLESIVALQAMDTQTLERITALQGVDASVLESIAALQGVDTTTNEGDVVLDPFCGCATTCVAAEQLSRQWVGIDISKKAIELVRTRLEYEVGFFGQVISRDDIPKRSEGLPNYRTHKHTLYGEQEGLCNGCKTHFPFQNMTVDHIVPQSKGGTDHYDNLQLLCNYCNSLKGTGTQEELVARLKEQSMR